jgi:hypothetical protein
MPALAVEGDTKRKTPPPMQALEAPTRKTPSPMETPQVLAVSSQSMAPVVESRNLPLSDFAEVDPETEIDPLASRQGEVAAKGLSIWNNPETFEPDEPSVVVRSKSLVLAALAEDAARTDAEDARADAEELKTFVPAELDDGPTKVPEQTELDDGPTKVPDDPTRMPDEGPTQERDSSRRVAARANQDSLTDDGPTSVMPDPGNDVPAPPSAMPAGWFPPGAQLPRPQTPRPGGPPERGSQDRITPLPPPPLMPEITDYPRLPSDYQSSAVPAATPVQGWMPAAPTVDGSPVSSRKKTVIAAAVGAVLLIATIAFATRGGDDTTPPRAGSDSIATPREPEPTPTPAPTETATPTETTGTATPTPPVPPPTKTTPRPPTKPPKVTPKVSAKPPAKKPPVKKPPVKKPPVKKPPVKKPPPKQQPEGWDPNSLFPKKR